MDGYALLFGLFMAVYFGLASRLPHQVPVRSIQVALRANGLEGILVGQLACLRGVSQSAASQHWRLFYPPVR